MVNDPVMQPKGIPNFCFPGDVPKQGPGSTEQQTDAFVGSLLLLQCSQDGFWLFLIVCVDFT